MLRYLYLICFRWVLSFLNLIFWETNALHVFFQTECVCGFYVLTHWIKWIKSEKKKIDFIQVLNCFCVPFLGFSTTLNESFGQIEETAASNMDVLYNWDIQSAGILEAVAFISVQELNLYSCRYGQVNLDISF